MYLDIICTHVIIFNISSYNNAPYSFQKCNEIIKIASVLRVLYLSWLFIQQCSVKYDSQIESYNIIVFITADVSFLPYFKSLYFVWSLCFNMISVFVFSSLYAG